MKDDQRLDTQELFSRVEDKLRSLFLTLHQTSSLEEQEVIFSQIIKTHIILEKSAPREFFECIKPIELRVRSFQKEIKPLLENIKSFRLEQQNLIITDFDNKETSGERIISAEELLFRLNPSKSYYLGYFTQLAFLLRKENFLFMQIYAFKRHWMKNEDT